MSSLLYDSPFVNLDTVDLPGEHLDPWDNELPVELWPDDTDAYIWQADDLTPTSDEIARQVDDQADAYRAIGSEVARMIASALDQLAVQIRMTAATTADELDARLEVLDRDIADQRAIGSASGLEY